MRKPLVTSLYFANAPYPSLPLNSQLRAIAGIERVARIRFFIPGGDSK